MGGVTLEECPQQSGTWATKGDMRHDQQKKKEDSMLALSTDYIQREASVVPTTEQLVQP